MSRGCARSAGKQPKPKQYKHETHPPLHLQHADGGEFAADAGDGGRPEILKKGPGDVLTRV